MRGPPKVEGPLMNGWRRAKEKTGRLWVMFRLRDGGRKHAYMTSQAYHKIPIKFFVVFSQPNIGLANPGSYLPLTPLNTTALG